MEATPTGNVGPSRTDPFTSKVIIDAPSAALEKGAGAALIAALGIRARAEKITILGRVKGACELYT